MKTLIKISVCFLMGIINLALNAQDLGSHWIEPLDVTLTADGEYEISYSLKDDTADIWLFVSYDNGHLYSGSLKNVSGDVGHDVSKGIKRAVWNPAEPYVKATANAPQFKIWAEHTGIESTVPEVFQKYIGEESYYGLRDQNTGTIICPAKFLEIEGTFGYPERARSGSPLIAKNKDGKWGLIDHCGNPMTDFKYDRLDKTNSNDYFKAGYKTNDGYQFGLINMDGKEIVPCNYDNIRFGNDVSLGFAILRNVHSDDVIFDLNSSEIIDKGSLEFSHYRPYYIRMNRNAYKKIYIDKLFNPYTHKELVSSPFLDVDGKGPYTFFENEKGLKGVYDIDSESISTAPKYVSASHDALVEYTDTLKIYYNYKHEKFLTLPLNSAYYRVGSNYYIELGPKEKYYKDIKKNGYIGYSDYKKGLRSISGDLIIPCEYDDIKFIENEYSEENGLAYARKGEFEYWEDRGMVLVNEHTTVWDINLKKPIFELVDVQDLDSLVYNGYSEKERKSYLECFSRGLSVGSCLKFLDEKTQRILNPDGKSCWNIYIANSDYIGVKRPTTKQLAILNRSGEVVLVYCKSEQEYLTYIPQEYKTQKPSTNGLRQILKDGRYGIVNEYNMIVVPCIYDEINDFVKGKAIVCREGLWGVINVNGTEIVPCRYGDKKYLPD